MAIKWTKPSDGPVVTVDRAGCAVDAATLVYIGQELGKLAAAGTLWRR